jgi:hypothetical protein
VLNVSNGRRIAELMDAPLELLEGVGHMFSWEQPERSAALLCEHALAAAPPEVRRRPAWRWLADGMVAVPLTEPTPRLENPPALARRRLPDRRCVQGNRP